MADNEKIAETLGTLLDQAARTSITRGAEYASGEYISRDSPAAWRSVAEVLVRLIDAKIEEKLSGSAEGLQEGIRPVPRKAGGDQEAGDA